MSELLTGKPLFPGKDEPQQMALIIDKCGAPKESTWPNVSNLRFYSDYVKNSCSESKLHHYFKDQHLYLNYYLLHQAVR